MKRELNLFARWLIKHYETSTDGDAFCYRNPMGDFVDTIDIVDHYIKDQKPEIAETEELVEKFKDKINNIQDIDPELNDLISHRFWDLT
jgi:hypothetical protein